VIGRDCDLNDTPNTFSPNGDNVNDELAFTVEGGKVYEANIFTRWGLLVKKIGPEESTWDGTDQNGELVTDGTYYYTLKVQMVNNEWKNLEGFITIFR
jgi:gliding motility-associated-like protein